MSHQVEGADWAEPVLLWLSICMQTGMGKSSLRKFLRKLVQQCRIQSGLNNVDPSWLLEDQSFEEMGESMSLNHSKLLGLYDELSTFLTQINVCRGRGLGESHEVSIFLQLYGGDPWTRKTGEIFLKILFNKLSSVLLLVSGEANFSMPHTGLTIGGFTQPIVACNLLENQVNVEKGLCQRFLWIAPQTNYYSF